MAKEKQKILFVSHKANRSGAPVLLLEIITAFSTRANIPFQIICMEEGELIPAFKKLGQTFIWQKKDFFKTPEFMAGLLSIFNRLVQVLRGLLIMYSVRKCTLVFYNTIVNGHLQHKLSFLSAKSVCYVHELEAAIHMLTNEAGRKYVFGETDLFLCVSNAVRNNLITKHQVSQSICKVIASPVNTPNRLKQQYAGFVQQFREKFQTGNAFIIGLSGSNEWRKGIDLLVPLAVLYFRLFPLSNVFFVWKGFREAYYTSYFDMHDYEKCAYKKNILLLPYGNDNIEQMACYDIHLLLSREDPYPLVVLEAAAMGIPTVCFDGAGGAPEFVEEDCGYIVPYGDLFQMAQRLHDLSENKNLLHEMSNNCRRKVTTRHNKEESLKQFTDILLNTAANKKI